MKDFYVIKDSLFYSLFYTLFYSLFYSLFYNVYFIKDSPMLLFLFRLTFRSSVRRTSSGQ